MRLKIFMAALLLSGLAFAREPKHYESGTLLRMDSVECGIDEKSGNSFAGEIIGTDSAHKKTQAVLCQEYVLQSDHLTYHIRPKDMKHPVLLPVGGKAQFRINKDKLILRVEDMDDKDRDYTVVSVTQREESKPAQSAAVSNQH
ncbi:MAG TPA: hypothetical protein VMH85_16580 [Terriglobales bacterium]|nr:hypothetical protein [Terriglobales bacterium]